MGLAMGLAMGWRIRNELGNHLVNGLYHKFFFLMAYPDFTPLAKWDARR